jgi:hypothetical protein
MQNPPTLKHPYTKEDICLVTLTGSRQASFSLCEKYMERQSIKWNKWIVVDDCLPRTVCTCDQTVYNPPWIWEESCTINKNIKYIVPYLRNRLIFFIEDDDWYHPDYLRSYLEMFNMGNLIVGEGHSKYYNVLNSHWKLFNNTKHSSLFQTAAHLDLIRSSHIETFNNHYFDIFLWKYAQKWPQKRLFIGRNLSLGMKGMPGRKGFVQFHQASDGGFAKTGLSLREYVGDKDAEYYEKFKLG